MVASNTAVHRAMERSGVGMLQPAQGLSMLQQLAAALPTRAPSKLAAIPFSWQRFMQLQRNASAFFYAEYYQIGEAFVDCTPCLLSGSNSEALVWQQSDRQTALAAATAAATTTPPVPSVKQVLQQVTDAIAGIQGGSIDPQQPLVQAGLDSLGGCSRALTSR